MTKLFYVHATWQTPKGNKGQFQKIWKARTLDDAFDSVMDHLQTDRRFAISRALDVEVRPYPS